MYNGCRPVMKTVHVLMIRLIQGLKLYDNTGVYECQVHAANHYVHVWYENDSRKYSYCDTELCNNLYLYI